MAERRSWASYVIWGSVAVSAVLAASLTIALVVGSHRGIQFTSLSKRAAPSPPPIERPQVKATPPAPAVTERDLARVDDALRALAAQRDRLAARLEQLERSVGDITASINERTNAAQTPPSVAVKSGTADPAPGPEPSAAAMKTAEKMAPGPTASSPTVVAAPVTATPRASARQAPNMVGDPLDIFRPYAAVQPAVTPPAPDRAPMQVRAAARTTEPSARAPEPSGTTRTEFAVDLGGDTSMERLRTLWASLNGNHGTALRGLQPLVSVREGGKPGQVEFRLIAGPLANAGTAARICATLQAKGAACHTAVYDGQRLAQR